MLIAMLCINLAYFSGAMLASSSKQEQIKSGHITVSGKLYKTTIIKKGGRK